jgi:3-methyladenine DNA glycosylase AlkD
MNAATAAQAFVDEIVALPSSYITPVREVRRAHSRKWKDEPAAFVTAVALDLMARRQHRWERWMACELIRNHKGAFAALSERTVAKLAVGLDSWDSVDTLGRIVTGPAWVRGNISDALVDRWSRSKDLWLRRLALVSTIALNMEMDGGRGDTRRTLAICTRMVDDREDMIVKAMSWALRILSDTDRKAVEAFVAKYETRLAARVKREVATKLRTGRKNPSRAK